MAPEKGIRLGEAYVIPYSEVGIDKGDVKRIFDKSEEYRRSGFASMASFGTNHSEYRDTKGNVRIEIADNGIEYTPTGSPVEFRGFIEEKLNRRLEDVSEVLEPKEEKETMNTLP